MRTSLTIEELPRHSTGTRRTSSSGPLQTQAKRKEESLAPEKRRCRGGSGGVHTPRRVYRHRVVCGENSRGARADSDRSTRDNGEELPTRNVVNTTETKLSPVFFFFRKHRLPRGVGRAPANSPSLALRTAGNEGEEMARKRGRTVDTPEMQIHRER